ncbi:uncharacterized protein G2W53_024625 [Senna tora]|uniref:Uncharacterized protein n=1 Tax=Senna tora TaxID=362788 RepID=A0A834WDA8_9FABA|nr:uncharacterized protein G2W53_024625 [Senna tora]
MGKDMKKRRDYEPLKNSEGVRGESLLMNSEGMELTFRCLTSMKTFILRSLRNPSW